MMPNKRSELRRFDDFNLESYGLESEADTMMQDYVDNALTASLMSGYRHHRLPRGIIEECCLKACSLDTMREFCA